MKKQIMVLTFLSAATLACYGYTQAGEHPKEHPTSHEHPAQAQPAGASQETAPAAQPTQSQSTTPAEHPKKEHPGHEHPGGMSPKEVKKTFTKTVEEHVATESRKSDGAFKINDSTLNKDWNLQLKKIHKNKIANLGGDKFFACADFKEKNGSKKKVDLDFYIQKGAAGWQVEKVLIHKVEGKPRFTYNEKNEMIPVQ
ncbi:MAG: hypothetical protein HY400_04140 [Elusimicrobia bacterium]|nr:hypothetical protein [Elusimicrobiota bacterium]